MQSAKREQKFLDSKLDESRYFSTALNRKRAEIPRDSEKNESRYLHISMQLAGIEKRFLYTVIRM